MFRDLLSICLINCLSKISCVSDPTVYLYREIGINKVRGGLFLSDDPAHQFAADRTMSQNAVITLIKAHAPPAALF